jgi:hypothetical protein
MEHGGGPAKKLKMVVKKKEGGGGSGGGGGPMQHGSSEPHGEGSQAAGGLPPRARKQRLKQEPKTEASDAPSTSEASGRGQRKRAAKVCVRAWVPAGGTTPVSGDRSLAPTPLCAQVHRGRTRGWLGKPRP